MKIAALRLYNVRRFARKGVAIEGIGDGVNVLCAANEFGKSTSFEALHALFFQPHTGVPKDVRNLQPYSGGNPLIEADIVTSQGRFRLTKQFIGGKRATVESLDDRRLIAQADEAERFIAGLVRGGTAGPAGLLWVRQGITGIEERDRKEQEGERRVRESLLTSVQGEVEAITGGRRMSEILDACNEELGKLVTPTMKPRANGHYDIAVDNHARLVEEEKRLSAEVVALREALDERAAILRRLTELEEAGGRAERRGAVEKAEAAFEAAKLHTQALKTAEAETALARSWSDAAERELSGFREAMQQAGKLSADLATAEEQRAKALYRRAEATAANERAMAAVLGAEAEERAARELLARLDAALKAREAGEQLSGLRERLARAEALRVAQEEKEAALALAAIPAGSIERLRALEVGIAGLRATEEAGLPSVCVAYEMGASDTVLMDGAPLADGEERSIRDHVRLDIPGIGTLTLRSNRPAKANDALKAAEDERRGLLAASGVADLAEASLRQSQAQEITAERDRLRFELRHLAPEGLAKLREEVARQAALPPADLELTGDPEEARRSLTLAGQRVESARNVAREVQPSAGRAADLLVQAEAAHAGLRGEQSRLDAILGPEEARASRERTLAHAFLERHSAFEQLEARAAGLRRTAPDLESVEAARRRTRSAEQSAIRDEMELRERLANLNGQIRTRSDDAVEETWREAVEALSVAAGRLRAFETEVAVLVRLRTALQSSRSAARDLYLEPVLTELHPLLGLLFDDISVAFDEKTLLPHTIRRNGQEEEIERLSGGMREQLSVLTRLAFARLLARDGRPAPVILDDALVYSDDDRIERMFDALHRQSREQQIIVFSCRQRAFSKLGGTVLRAIDWQPSVT